MNPKNPYESIYGLESEYISYLAIEYEYNYPWRDMDLSPLINDLHYTCTCNVHMMLTCHTKTCLTNLAIFIPKGIHIHIIDHKEEDQSLKVTS